MFFGVNFAFSCRTASPCFSKVGGSGRFGDSGDEDAAVASTVVAFGDSGEVDAAVASTVVAVVLSFVAIIASGDDILIGLGVVVVIG